AVMCWFLTFAQSAPVWSLVPGLPLLQFPWRLLGPLGICLAVASAGALARPIVVLEDRWGDRGRWLGLGLVVLVGGVGLFNHLGDREVYLDPTPSRQIDGRTVVEDEIRDVRGVGTTSNREFLPREVYIATYTVGTPRGRNVIERLYPEADWLGGLLYPLSGDLRVLGWRAIPLRLGVRVANDGNTPAQLAVRQLRFAGWRAWIDGSPVPIDVAPYVEEQQAALGFMVVAVPPGEHTVNLAFGPSPLRAAALIVSLATWLAASAALVWTLGRRRRWPPAAAVAVWLLLAILPGYATWRGLWPMLGRFATGPVAAAHAIDGVWQGPGLHTGGAGLLVNLAEAVRTGQAQVDSPSGASVGPDRYVDVRQLTITDADVERGLAGTSRRQWLYLHPPSTASVDVAVPAKRTVWFQASLALNPAIWSATAGDGVRFQVSVAPLDASGREGIATTVLDRLINPRAVTVHRRWVPVEVDLSGWGGQTVRLTLRTLPENDLSFDWAGWGNPMVVVRETDRIRPLEGQEPGDQ
ncbi:MAG: hypothetical protein ACRDI2_17050, partial [Chloroflexota bacterium]